jgi:hypothetical protein
MQKETAIFLAEVTDADVTNVTATNEMRGVALLPFCFEADDKFVKSKSKERIRGVADFRNTDKLCQSVYDLDQVLLAFVYFASKAGDDNATRTLIIDKASDFVRLVKNSVGVVRAKRHNFDMISVKDWKPFATMTFFDEVTLKNAKVLLMEKLELGDCDALFVSICWTISIYFFYLGI